jgi:hypothetical protein
MQYSTDKHLAANLATISSERAYEVINLNKKGYKPRFLDSDEGEVKPKKEYQDILDESVTRFDSTKKRRRNEDRRDNFREDRRNQEPRKFVHQQPKILVKKNNESEQ